MRILLFALFVARVAAVGTDTEATTALPGATSPSASSPSGVTSAPPSVNTTEALVACPEPAGFFTGDGITFPGCENKAGKGGGVGGGGAGHRRKLRERQKREKKKGKHKLRQLAASAPSRPGLSCDGRASQSNKASL